MRRFLFVSTLVMFIALFLTIETNAQPPDGGQRGGRSGRGGAMMAMRFVPVEQVLGFLAFDSKVALENEQLLKVRDVLRDVHAKRADMMKSLQGADREAVMGKVRVLRGQMTQKLVTVLKPAQVEVLKKYMQNMNQRSGQRPDRQRGQRGGQRGG